MVTQKVKIFDYTPYSLPTEGSAGLTGSWRTKRPVIIEAKCTKCNLCWLYCPEGTIIRVKGKIPQIDLTYCKGCGVCANECPSKAIEMEDETKWLNI